MNSQNISALMLLFNKQIGVCKKCRTKVNEKVITLLTARFPYPGISYYHLAFYSIASLDIMHCVCGCPPTCDCMPH